MVSRMGDERLRDDYAARTARGEVRLGLFKKILRIMTFGYLRRPRSRRVEDADSDFERFNNMNRDELTSAIAQQYDKIDRG